MKLTKGNLTKDCKSQRLYHNKNASEDSNNYTKSNNVNNFLVSKFLNQSQNGKIKSEIINDNLPSLKTNIQNIFSDDDQKEKAIQYLIKIRKDKYTSPPPNFRRIILSEEKQNGNTGINQYSLKNNKYSQRIIQPIMPIVISNNMTDRSSDGRTPINKEKKN